MDEVYRLTVGSKSGLIDIQVSENYLYWNDLGKLKCYHLDSVVGVAHSVEQLRISVFVRLRFKSFSFLLDMDPSRFISVINSLLFKSPKHFLVLCNPLSGDHKSKTVLDEELLPVLSLTPYTYEVQMSQKGDFPIETIEKIGNIYTDVICLSGDGTVHKLITAIYRKSPSLLTQIGIGALPTGSRNSLALELNGKSLQTAIFNIIKGNYILGDMIKVALDSQEIVCTTAVMWGLSADIPYEAEKYKNLGKSRYILIGLKFAIVQWKRYAATVLFTDINQVKHKIQGEFGGICIGNHRARNIHNDECPFPNARIANGCLDLMTISAASRLRTIYMFSQIMRSGSHLANSIISYSQIKSCEIQAEKDFAFNVDGEIFVSKTLKVKSLPSSIKYFGTLLN